MRRADRAGANPTPSCRDRGLLEGMARVLFTGAKLAAEELSLGLRPASPPGRRAGDAPAEFFHCHFVRCHLRDTQEVRCYRGDGQTLCRGSRSHSRGALLADRTILLDNQPIAFSYRNLVCHW